jgi:peptidoglycan/LPS O-acetylase OafA/YrhL
MSVLLLVVAGVLTVWAASLHKVMTFDAGFVRCIYGFFFGVLAQRLRAYGKDPTRNFSAHSVAALEIVLTLAVLALIKYGSYVWLFALSPPLFAAATLVVAHEKGPLSRLLLTRPFHAIGEWSYSIYMVHAFLIVQVLGRLASLAGKHGFLGLDPNLGGDGGAYLGALYGQGLSGAVLVVGLLVATTLAFSSFTFRWIEKPGRSYFNALAARRTRVLRPPRVSALNPAE